MELQFNHRAMSCDEKFNFILSQIRFCGVHQPDFRCYISRSFVDHHSTQLSDLIDRISIFFLNHKYHGKRFFFKNAINHTRISHASEQELNLPYLPHSCFSSIDYLKNASHNINAAHTHDIFVSFQLNIIMKLKKRSI